MAGNAFDIDPKEDDTVDVGLFAHVVSVALGIAAAPAVGPVLALSIAGEEIGDEFCAAVWGQVASNQFKHFQQRWIQPSRIVQYRGRIH